MEKETKAMKRLVNGCIIKHKLTGVEFKVVERQPHPHNKRPVLIIEQENKMGQYYINHKEIFEFDLIQQPT